MTALPLIKYKTQFSWATDVETLILLVDNSQVTFLISFLQKQNHFVKVKYCKNPSFNFLDFIRIFVARTKYI